MAGNDYTMTIPPGATLWKPIKGDFLYMKFSDRAVEIIVEGSTALMEAGDNYRPGQRFDGFEVHNPTATQVRVLMIVGYGSFSRQIIQGEVSVAPGIRRADGTFVSDQRHDIAVHMVPAKDGDETRHNGDILETLPAPGVDWKGAYIDGENVILWEDTGGANLVRHTLDRNLAILDSEETGITAEYYTHPVLFPGYGYIWNAPGSNFTNPARVMGQPIGASGGTKLFDLPYSEDYVQDLAVKDGQIYVLPASVDQTSQEAVGIFDLEGNKVGAVPQFGNDEISGSWITYNPIEDRWVLSTSTSDQFKVLNGAMDEVIYERDGQPGLISGTSGGGHGFNLAVGDVVYSAGVSDAEFRKVQLFDRVNALGGTGTRANCRNELVRRDVKQRSTRAGLSVTYANGQTVIRGEVIKAALEYYYGALVDPASNYLDHVYSVTIDDPGGAALSRTVSNESGTLERAGESDDFQAALPSVVRLTVDSGLKFLNPLET